MEKKLELLYPAKKSFDQFVSSLPSDVPKAIPEQLKLAKRFLSFYNDGLPHKDRPQCLYYFYKYFSSWEDLNEKTETSSFNDVLDALPTIEDEKILSCIQLLDEEKLFEVCQIRGNLKTLDFVEYINDENQEEQWPEIKRNAEKYLASEPVLPISFLETYFWAYNSHHVRTNEFDASLYDLAGKVLKNSLKPKEIAFAYGYINNGNLLDYYMKSTLPTEEVTKINRLEYIEKQLSEEFGDYFAVRSNMGKAFNLLTKSGREERAAEKSYQNELAIKIRSAARSSYPYVEGYKNYLLGLVYINTGDTSKAIKSLKNAYDTNYNKIKILDLLIPILTTLKRYDEAAQFAQDGLDIWGIDDLNGQHSDEVNQLIKVIQEAGQVPKTTTRIYETIAKENTEKTRSLKQGLKSKIERARAENIKTRINDGIQLFDNLISAEVTDQAINSDQAFKKVTIDMPVSGFKDLSLEELEFFTDKDSSKLLQFYTNKATIDDIMRYIAELSNKQLGTFENAVSAYIEKYPNYSATLSIVSKNIAHLVEKDNLDGAMKLANAAIQMRSDKVKTLYQAIHPLIEKLSKQESCRDEIDLIKRAKKFLFENELDQARSDLTEAFIKEINSEKSLRKKKDLIEEAFAENLDDNRLKEFNKKVNDQLDHRKKMIKKIALIAGGIVVIAIVLLILL